MVAGTVAALWLLESLTTIPPVGAAPVRVTVPVDPVSPTTVVGETDTESSPGGVIVRVPD